MSGASASVTVSALARRRPASGARGRPARGARRTELLEATLRVVARDGPAAASHRAVAAEAGVPLGSTTYYFISREEMLLEALRHAASEEIATIRARVRELTSQPPGTIDWTAEITGWVLGQLRPARAARLIARYQLQLEAVHRPELRIVYGEWTGAALDLARTVLEAAGSSDPDADAPVLVATVDGLSLNQLALPDRRSRARAVTALVTRLMEHLTRV
ncbi:MAG: TetR/AcrR family transcriptional regulator [Solirubrobacteraceae bacterium]